MKGFLWKKSRGKYYVINSIFNKKSNQWKNSNHILNYKSNNGWLSTIENWQFERLFGFPESYGDWTANTDEIITLFSSNQDGDPVVRTFDNLIIPEGITLTPTNRCRGMYLYIKGDLTVNGTLSMTARGAYAVGKYVGIEHKYRLIFFNKVNNYPKEDNWTIIQAVGGIGAGTSGTPAGDTLACGAGGGSNTGSLLHAAVKGGNGTSFSGGAGCAGSYRMYGNNPVLAPNNYGGPSSSVKAGYDNSCGGGGAGNPGTRSAESGTGGLMILFVEGNINIGENGKIISSGSNGSSGTGGVSGPSAGGGGSGGGSIHIFYKGTINDTTKITAPGGAGGGGKVRGVTGGVGTVNIVKIDNNGKPIEIGE